MTENVFTPHTEPQVEPTLHRNLELPKGVLQKNLKTFVYLGAALLVIVAALFSSSGKKTPSQQASSKGQPPQPALQDNTDNNVQELKNQLQAERQKEQQATMAAAAMGDPALASATPQQRSAAAAYGPTGLAVPCIPGQPCPQAQQTEQAAFMARSQVMNRAENFKGVITTPAWRSKPSWMLVAGNDRTINPDLERWYATRAGSHKVEVAGASHSVYVSHPKEVAALIEDAAQHVR